MPALAAGDVLGLDVYVVTPSTPLNEAPAARRIEWKRQALGYWSSVAAQEGKQLWITEMQGAPWQDTPGFTPADLEVSAQAYRASSPAAVLFWGVESWLQSRDWMRAGRHSFSILRSPVPLEALAA